MDPEKPSGINKWTLPAGSKVIDLALGRQHTLILVQEPYSIRSLWGAGSNHFGQLLSPHLGRSVVSLHRLYSSCDVLKVAVGMDHSVLLHENGTVSTAGWSSDGQCGRGHQEEQFNFNQSMEAFWDDTLVVDISAGADHSLALTESGQVYAWGNSEYGQCCNGEKVPQLSVPKRVAHQAGWIQSIRTCASSTLLQNRKKEWWYYGMENAQGIRLPLNDMLSKGGNTFLSTSHHNFLNIQADAIFKGKSKFQLDMKLPRAPLMVSHLMEYSPMNSNLLIEFEHKEIFISLLNQTQESITSF
ncbi:Williams-Beuren syndrome chromosome region 16 protein [Coelomomyces lativittatus]|nr:Williams-Beuren syndrome chromosome region 16 protein [Coelomomyces lativittatus]